MDKHARVIRPIREILLPMVVLLAVASCIRLVRFAFSPIVYARSWQSTKPADITHDPHYRILLENAQIRVFEVALPPGSESFVWHENNFLIVTPAASDIIIWKGNESPVLHSLPPDGEIRFFLGRSAQGLRNNTRTEYRNITVEFLDPRVTNYGYRYESGNWDYGSSICPSPVDPQGHFVNSLDLEKAVANDVQLLPGESLPAMKRASLVIAVTPVQLADGAGRTISLKPGQVLWHETNATALTNTGRGRERFAMVEFRLPSENY
jgi:hypothetical protein